jgi:hypothetical protein
MNVMSVNPATQKPINFKGSQPTEKLSDSRYYTTMVNDALGGTDLTPSQLTRLREQNSALDALITRWNLNEQLAAIQEQIAKAKGESTRSIGFNKQA